MDNDALRIARLHRMVEAGLPRAIRMGAGLSVQQVAASLGVARVQVWRWESGYAFPRTVQALAYLRLLDALMAGDSHAS